MSQPPSPTSSTNFPVAASIGLNEVSGMFDWMDGKIDEFINPRVIVLLLVVIAMVYFVINALAGGGTAEVDNKESTLFANVSILEIFLWAILIVIVILNGFQYFFNTNITTEVSNLFSAKPEITISQNAKAGIPYPRQYL